MTRDLTGIDRSRRAPETRNIVDRANTRARPGANLRGRGRCSSALHAQWLSRKGLLLRWLLSMSLHHSWRGSGFAALLLCQSAGAFINTTIGRMQIAAHATALSECCNLSQRSMADTAFIRASVLSLCSRMLPMLPMLPHGYANRTRLAFCYPSGSLSRSRSRSSTH
ncbi:hypothetical protein B0J14DRAFT_128206 [Halenospora varia]|nr:hypothetical protein B0J14DRAFT_128206 [Halenospora varia]